MDRELCTKALRHPDCAPETERRDGHFIRNLDREGVKKRYGEDKDPPEFGYKVRPEKWTWEKKREWRGLSVNLATCINGQHICSILLHDKPHLFKHVVILDLEALSQEIGIVLVATYAPIEEPNPNPCHFNILPDDVPIGDMMKSLVEYLQFTFPLKFPRSDADREQALKAKKEYERVFQIVRNVQV